MLKTNLDSKIVAIILVTAVMGAVFLINREYLLTEKEIINSVENGLLEKRETAKKTNQ